MTVMQKMLIVAYWLLKSEEMYNPTRQDTPSLAKLVYVRLDNFYRFF